MSHRAWLLVLSLLLLLFSSAAYGDPGTIYKWTDKEGNVHYTDCPPPPGCKAETVETEAAPKVGLSNRGDMPEATRLGGRAVTGTRAGGYRRFWSNHR